MNLDYRHEIDQMKQELYEMKKSLAALERIQMKPSVEDLLRQGHKWRPWYAWFPIKDIHGQWHWREHIYRIKGNTYVDHDNWAWHYYGTVFDVLGS